MDEKKILFVFIILWSPAKDVTGMTDSTETMPTDIDRWESIDGEANGDAIR